VIYNSLKCPSTGKACFLTEHDGKECELINATDKNCTNCTPSVQLPKSGQRVLEHMGAHILFDSSVDPTLKPCGLCLRPSPLCAFYLKKTKGGHGSNQINARRSTCANMTKFSYGIAAISTSSSPCSNIPIRCHHCPESAPAVWRYNIKAHIMKKHPYVPISEYRDSCQITQAERTQMKGIWNNRHRSKKTRKGKRSKRPLVISEAHSSRLILR
jgi:hypothetical protein